MMLLPIAELMRQATQRPEGYLQDVLSRGIIRGDRLELTDEAYAELCAQYRGSDWQKATLVQGCRSCGG